MPSTNQVGREKAEAERPAADLIADKLKGVDQLVSQDVIVVRGDAGQGNEDAPAEALGHPPFAGGDQPRDGVGLLEVGEAVVEDDLLRRAETEPQQVRVVGIPALKQVCRVQHRGCFPGVVIDLKMIRLQDGEVDDFVGNLVPPE